MSTATPDLTTTPAPSRVADTFARLKADGRIAIMPYHAAGYPTLDLSEAIIRGMVEAGADLVEIGIPFSDPISDGTSVQMATQVALSNGTRPKDVFELVRRLRASGVSAPFLLMGYFNPIFKYGIERFVADSAAAGADGFIVPDLPVEESVVLHEACRAHGRDLIFMIAPTSTDERIRIAAQVGSGFLYCVSVKGVTGARDQMSTSLGTYLDRIRTFTNLPLAVGFGISRPDHVATVAEHADGAIVGAALINHLAAAPDEDKPAAAAAFVRFLRGEQEL